MNEKLDRTPYLPTVAVGIDVVETKRVFKLVERWGERFLNRFMTPLEQRQCGGKPERMAVLIAAKEATSKALGTGLRGVGWKEMEIVHATSGKPSIRLHGRAATIAEGLGWASTSVSLTHGAGVSVAVVVAIGVQVES